MKYIYIIKNTINHGVYVGSTNNIVNRWRQHRYYLSNKKHHSVYLQRSWDKHGECAFVFDVVEIVEPHEDLIAREQWWIDHYLQSGRAVYNMCKIAGCMTGYTWSNEQIIRISNSRKGKKFTEKQRKNVSDGHAALNNPVDLISPEGVVYFGIKNVREFCRQHNLISTALSKVVSGALKQHKGWSRADNPYSPKTFGFVDPCGKVYKGIQRCDVFCAEHGLSRKNMSAVHVGHKKSHKGWTKYLETEH